MGEKGEEEGEKRAQKKAASTWEAALFSVLFNQSDVLLIGRIAVLQHPGIERDVH